MRTVGFSTDGHGRAALAACSGLTFVAEPGVHPRVRARRPASSQETAAGAARPWPSEEKPTVRTDRDGAQTPSAMRPWTPRHSGPQRYKMTHHGTEKNRPA